MWRNWYTAVDWRKHHEFARKQKCWYKNLALWFAGSNPVMTIFKKKYYE